jgi:two-component system phosphate regulon sensor histidine kinase PhoR
MPNGGAVAVLFDLSEVERLEKTRRDFIANVSHELRTPLTSIQGYTETLLDAPPGDASMTHEFLEIIRKNAARMSRLTEDLLTLARVESGEQNFRFHPVPASTLLQNAYETFAEVARSRDVELTIESNSEELVQADEDAIQQVFANLIDNAIKYSSAGAQVFLGVRKVDSRPNKPTTGSLGASNLTLEFFVKDTGQGIPSEHLPRLFERFYRVDKARSRESGGTGLGLAIVKHIIRVHGGSVRAESQLGYGSEFSFRLPLAARGVVVAETQSAR